MCSTNTITQNRTAFNLLLQKVQTHDDLDRSVPSSCYTTALSLADQLERASQPLPDPLPCGDPEETPGIYLQWPTASLYLYEDHVVYIGPDSQFHTITGTVDEQVSKLVEIITKDSLTAYDLPAYVK